MDVAKLNNALEAAFVFLGQQSEATHVLRDILVEEISFVDRAANRRRFLVIKQKEPGNADPVKETGIPMETEKQELLVEDDNMIGDSGVEEGEEEEEKQDSSLPIPVKEGLLRILTESLERLVSVSNQVKDMEETSEEVASPLPDMIGNELKEISDLIASALSRYPSPMSTEKAEGIVSNSLRDIGEKSIELSKVAADSDELDVTIIEALRKLAVELNALVEKYPQPQAKIESEEIVEEKQTEEKAEEQPEVEAVIEEKADPEVTEEEKAEVVEEEKSEEDPETAEEEKAEVSEEDKGEETVVEEKLSNLGSEVSDKLNVLAQAIIRIADAPSPDDLVAIRDQMLGVAKALEPEVRKPVVNEKLTTLVEAIKGFLASDETPTETEKRALENVVQSPERAEGDLSGVGHDGPNDRPQAEAETDPALADVMKKLEGLENKVKDIAETPLVPASRTETQKTEAQSRPKRKRGGPWIM